MPKESTNWVTRLKGKVKEHSPAGKLYKELGGKGAEEHYKRKQTLNKRAKRIAALGKSKTTVQKEQGTYISPSVGSSMRPAIQEWIKTEGLKGGVTQKKVLMYKRAMKRWPN